MNDLLYAPRRNRQIRLHNSLTQRAKDDQGGPVGFCMIHVLHVQEMNPASEGFQRVFKNPFAYAAFKSTEPWLMEYMSLDLAGSLRAAGFSRVLQAEATPRHLTAVATKGQ